MTQNYHAMIDVREGGEYAMLWFLPGTEMNWLACVFRLDGGPWTLRYRFRYFDSDGDDARYSMYEATAPDAYPERLAAILRAGDAVATELIGAGFLSGEPGAQLWRVDLESCGPMDLLVKFAELPFLTVEMPPGMAKA